jgi:hypothetical protein
MSKSSIKATAAVNFTLNLTLAEAKVLLDLTGKASKCDIGKDCTVANECCESVFIALNKAMGSLLAELAEPATT